MTQKMTLSSFNKKDSALKMKLNAAFSGVSMEEMRDSDEYWIIIRELREVRKQAVEAGLFNTIHEASEWSDRQSRGMDAAKREAMEQYQMQESLTDDSIEFD